MDSSSSTMEPVENSYCRLCAELTPTSKLFDLHLDSEKSREVVEKLTRLKHEFINMFRDDVLPKTVCFLCLDALYRSATFVQRIQTSQTTLRTIFNVNIKEEPSAMSDKDDTLSEADVGSGSIKSEKKKIIKIKSETYIERVSTTEDSSDDDEELRKYIAKRRYLAKQRRKVMELKTWRDYSWQCAFCSTQFSTCEDLRKHSMELHDCCTAFKCTDCNIRKLKLDPFLSHLMRHRKYLKRSCYACNFKFNKRTDAEKHRRAHIKHDHVCSGCHMSFKTAKDLTDHESKYYTDKRATRILRPASESELVCKVCDKKFKTRAVLQSHALIHTNRRRDHTCDVCGKCFFNKDTLMSHMIVHNDTRPYKCEICKFSFKTIGQLRMHVGTHDTERPFACEQCGKRFRLRKNLNSHMITHSDTLPHVCEFCHKGFRFKTILNQHIRQHTGVKPYSCNLCQRAFTNWSNYNKHMKRRHGMEMAKKKHTPAGVFPINPVTGEVVISPPSIPNTEEWKKSVLQRKKCVRVPQEKIENDAATMTNLPHLTNQTNLNSLPNMNSLPNLNSQPVTPDMEARMSSYKDVSLIKNDPFGHRLQHH